MQFPNISGPLLLWVIAGLASAVFVILTIPLQKSLGYLVRSIFEPARDIGKKPGRKSIYLWSAWLIAGMISIVSTGLASLNPDNTEPAGTTNTAPPTKVFSVPAGENLVPNPSFEHGALQPAGWLGSAENAKYTWSSETAHTNQRSVCIRYVQENVTAEWRTNTWLKVDSGRSYHFSIWATGDIDGDVYFGIAPLNADGEWLTGYGVPLPINPSSWTQSEGEYTIPYMGSFVMLTLEVSNPNGLTEGFVCFDDVLFAPDDSSP